MHPGSPSDSSGTATAEAKPRYVYSILKPHGQSTSSKKPVRPLSCKEKRSYIYTILKKHHLPRVGPKQLCALAHLGCTHEAGTPQFLIKQYHVQLLYLIVCAEETES